MEDKLAKIIARFILYMRRTWKQKIASLAVIGSALWVAIITGDGTYLAAILPLAAALFFISENYLG